MDVFFDCLRLSLRDVGRSDEFEQVAAPWRQRFERLESLNFGGPTTVNVGVCKFMFFDAWQQGLLQKQHLPADFNCSWDFYANNAGCA